MQGDTPLVAGAIGVDGCKGGWVAAIRLPGGEVAMHVVPRFSDLLGEASSAGPIAVDMPIGLPDAVGHGGRGPEAAVRPLLAGRRPSVFSISSRDAVYAEPGPFASLDDWYAAHRRASEVARSTSKPPKGISIQAFGIFAKIRELDMLLRDRPEWRTRIVESHPEVAFWRLNGERAMRLPKKAKGQVNAPGMDERRNLLERLGVPSGVLHATPPRGAATDDARDACAMLLVAECHGRGMAVPHPDPPVIDSEGIPMAIWS